MKKFIKKYYLWSLVLLNSLTIIAFLFIVLANKYPVLYELFSNSVGGRSQEVISVGEYAKAFLPRNIIASFLLAFPVGYIFKLSCEENKKDKQSE